ncbi:MAG: hypothetical protein MUC69_07335 [Gemmatimonadales bacterium]|nr:hypothetical protein [Gemmatimonadales bacterium]
MKERAVRFGSAKGLVGIVTEPAVARAGAPFVVFLNAGLIHRVGASRLHVQLARRLAAAGVTSLRFDFSGVGDSEARTDTLPFEESAVLETREAMDYLAQSRGAERFVLVGLCSGADAGFYTAQQDARVVGLCQLDPFAYRTPAYWVRFYGPRLVSPSKWREKVANGVRRVERMLQPAPAAVADGAVTTDVIPSPYDRAFPPKATVEAGLRTLVQRGVRMLVIFTNALEDHYNHEGQYRAAFRHLGVGSLLEERFYPRADHVLSGLDAQARALREIAEWVEKST